MSSRAFLTLILGRASTSMETVNDDAAWTLSCHDGKGMAHEAEAVELFDVELFAAHFEDWRERAVVLGLCSYSWLRLQLFSTLLTMQFLN